MKIFIQFIVSVLYLIILVTTPVRAVSDTTEPVTKPAGLQRRSAQNVVEKYNGMETLLRLTLGNDLYGSIEGKACDHCKKIRLSVTPATKAYKNNIEVPLVQAKSRSGRFATVVYEVKTKTAIAIRW